MKKYFAIVLAAVAAVACQKEINGPEATKGVFTASMETCYETKTFTDESLQVKWSENDYLNIWNHTSIADKYTISSSSVGKNTADLQCVEAAGSSETGSSILANIGYYPYDKGITCAAEGNGYKLSNASLPATQKYIAGSFGNGAQPMVAVTSGENDHALAFHNICGVMRIVLTGDITVRTMSVTGNNGEILCGAAEITASNTAMPAITMTGSGKTVTLDCGEGVKLNEASETSFDIVLPPVTFEKGFIVKINGVDYLKTNNQHTVLRSHILRMGNKTAVGSTAIEGKVTVSLTGTGTIISNGSKYYSRTYKIANNSIVDIYLDQIGTSNFSNIKKTLKAGGTDYETLYFRYNINPTVTVKFTYNGQSYSITTK